MSAWYLNFLKAFSDFFFFTWLKEYNTTFWSISFIFYSSNSLIFTYIQEHTLEHCNSFWRRHCHVKLTRNADGIWNNGQLWSYEILTMLTKKCYTLNFRGFLVFFSTPMCTFNEYLEIRRFSKLSYSWKLQHYLEHGTLFSLSQIYY